MPKVLNYIPDGYTETGYIAEVPRIHGEVRFTFRPMLNEERAIVYGRRAKELSPRELEQQFAAEIVARVNEWSLVQDDGSPLAITRENVLRLKPMLFQRLFQIVAGSDASDVDPTWPQEAKAEVADAKIEATLLDRPAGAVLQEHREKNSG